MGALGVFADEAAPAESGEVVDDVADKAEVNENLEAEKFGNIHTVINGVDYHSDVDPYTGNTYQDHAHLTYDSAHGANHHHGHLHHPNDGGHTHGYDGGHVHPNNYGHGHGHGYDYGHGHGHGYDQWSRLSFGRRSLYWKHIPRPRPFDLRLRP